MHGEVGGGSLLWEWKETRGEREEENKTGREWERNRGKTMEDIEEIGNESRTLSALSNSFTNYSLKYFSQM